jgi:hypothetical protein
MWSLITTADVTVVAHITRLCSPARALGFSVTFLATLKAALQVVAVLGDMTF